MAVDERGKITLPPCRAKATGQGDGEDACLFARERYQPCIQAGFVAASGVPVDNAIFGGLIDHGDGNGEKGLGLGGVTGLQCLAELPQLGAETGCIGAVLRGAGQGLPGALERRYMICHLVLLSFGKFFR